MNNEMDLRERVEKGVRIITLLTIASFTLVACGGSGGSTSEQSPATSQPATTFNSAVEILKGMYGFNGIALPNAILVRLGNLSNIFIDLGVTSYLGGGSVFIFSYLWIIFLFFIALIMPNTQQIMKSYSSYEIERGNALFDAGIFSDRLTFRFNSVWAFIMATIMVFAIFGLTRLSEFLYFQF